MVDIRGLNVLCAVLCDFFFAFDASSRPSCGVLRKASCDAGMLSVRSIGASSAILDFKILTARVFNFLDLQWHAALKTYFTIRRITKQQ